VGVVRWILPRQRRLTLGVGVASTLLLAGGQLLAGFAVDVSVFYLVPILLVTLLVGETPGLALALFSATLNATVSLQWLHHALPLSAIILNDFFRLMTFSYVALASSWIVRQRDRLHHQARTDALTGLPNYRALLERLEEEVARAARYRHGLAIIAMDFDHFKLYNDRLGHQEGNVLLQQITRLVQLAIRQSDRAFRYGGDELIVLLPETSAAAAGLLADRIRQQIERDYTEAPVAVTASFGVACILHRKSPGELLALADAAMYRAKRAGGNRVEVAASAADGARAAAPHAPAPSGPAAEAPPVGRRAS